jgi:membrane protease YdiL (CAAX protease family)
MARCRRIVMSALTQAAVAGASAPTALRHRSLPAFFGLVFVLTIPFFVLNALTERELFPNIPISALMVVCPLLAASILVYRENGAAGVTTLLKQCVDYRRIRPLFWYVPILLLLPVVTVLMYAIMVWVGEPVHPPQFSPLTVAFLVVILFLMGVGEEAGWMGYAIDPMQERLGALGAGIILGVIWAVWHMIPLLQVGRAPEWITWWTLFTVASRVLITWLYNSTGRSVLAAILFHFMMNVSYVLFPIDGSHYDYQIAGLIVTAIAVVITVIGGPRTLARLKVG